MTDPNLFSPFKESFASAQSILIALPKNVNYDKMAAGLSLFLSLKKAGKTVEIVAPQEVKVEFSSLVGVDQVKTKIGGRNLTISFDYVEDSIEKVSYNIEGGKFNLVIQPKAGLSPLSAEKVQYTYGGAQTDLILIIGARNFEDLGEIYRKEKKSFEETKKISIDVGGRKPFGGTEIAVPEASSITEIVGTLIFQLKLPADEDIASNLLLGIETATGSFSSARTNANTFELAAYCLRLGAKRKTPKGELPEMKRIKEARLEPMPPAVSAATPPVPQEEEEPAQPKPDWFAPKIYKGDTKL